MALTNTAVMNAKPGAKPRKLADEKGLFLPREMMRGVKKKDADM